MDYKSKLVLDELAPIMTIQTRANYAPWLEKETKQLQKRRNIAHKKAAESGDQDDWRHYRNLRNQATSKSRKDKQNWEKKKLNLAQNNPTIVWKTIKSWLGWDGGGPPTHHTTVQ